LARKGRQLELLRSALHIEGCTRLEVLHLDPIAARRQDEHRFFPTPLDSLDAAAPEGVVANFGSGHANAVDAF
jgi:hypothetical protein